MRRLIVPAVLVTLAALTWCVWPAHESTLPRAAALGADTAVHDAVPLTFEAAPTVAASPAAPDVRTEVPAPAASEAGPLATLRGRCVDEHGAPIQGVDARLSGWGANSQRTEAWLKEHAEPVRIDETVSTGADGVFEFRFWPPPPFQFALRLTKAGRATMSERWSELEAGSTKDIGSITMGAGTLLRGSVIDSDGAPVAEVSVHFRRIGRPAGGGSAHDWDIGYARGGNTCVGRAPLAAGEYGIEVPHREVVRPTSVTITGEQSEQSVEIVLAAIDPAATITGVVVDEANAPLRGVQVTTSIGGSGWINSTDASGGFRVTRPKQHAPEKVGLSFEARGFDRLSPSEEYAWGRHDLRFVLRRAVDVEVTVVADGRPVEEFALRILPEGGAMSSQDFEVRARGKHPGGRVVVPGVRRGRHTVVVEPTDRSLAVSEFVSIEVTGAASTVVTIPLSSVALRPLRVQRADGTPLAEAKVQLVDPLGITGRVTVYPIERWGWQMGGTKALELQVTATDARGEAVLRGPGGRTLAVFLPGPANAPLWQGDVRLDVDAPLLITVAPAARLVGSLGPLELLQEWRRLADLPILGPLDDRQLRVAPAVCLTRMEAGVREQHPAKPVPVDETGGFEIDGAPPGAWQLTVSWWRAMGGLGRTGDSADAGRVELRAGEVTRVDPADASGRRGRSESATTTADGRFHLRLPSGEYELALEVASKRWADTLRAEGTVHVVRERTARTFHVNTGSVRVRLLDASGTATSGATIELRDPADKPRQSLPPTGDDGWTVGEIESGVFTACVLPRRLQDPKAQQEVWRANPGSPDPFAVLRLRLGSVAVRVGETTSVELRLPPEFAK